MNFVSTSIATLAALLAAASAPLSAQNNAPIDQVSVQDGLSLQDKALVRCSAAFAMVSHGQANGNEAALKWPVLDERGKEFFVRALADVMDRTGKSREEISQLVSAQAQQLWDQGTLDQVMPGCLLMLETSDI